MKGNILVTLAFLLLHCSCLKITGESKVKIKVVDAQTGKPMNGVKVFASGLDRHNGGNGQQHRVIELPSTDEKGVIETRITKETFGFEYDWGYFYFFCEDPSYAYETVEIPSGSRIKKTLMMYRAAEIDIDYHHTNPNSVIDSFAVGVKLSGGDFSKMDMNFELVKYMRTHNLFPNERPTVSSDTSVKIICNPITTGEFYYRVPGKTIHEKCLLNPGEIKKIHINY